MRHIQLFEGYKKLKYPFLREPGVAQRVADQLGVSIAAYLAEGTAGTAHLLQDGTVLKLTGDKTEALAAELLLGKDLPHIVPIYDVLRVTDAGGNVFYAITKALVQPLTAHPNYGQIVTTLEHLNYSRRSGARVSGLYDQYKEMAQTNHTYQREISLDMLDVWREMLREMESAGFVSYDIYPENCGLYRGEIVFFDIGYAKLPKKAQVRKSITLG